MMLFTLFSCRSRTDTVARSMFRRPRAPHKQGLSAVKLPAAVLSVIAVIMLSFPGGAAFASPAAPTGSPEFSIEASKSTVTNGTILFVTLTCENKSSAVITSFQGTVEYDSGLFEFQKAEFSDNYLNSSNMPTIKVDTKNKSRNSIGFTFADPSDTILAPGSAASGDFFLRLYFLARSQKNTTASIGCTIIDCYSGSEKDKNIYRFCDETDPISLTPCSVSINVPTTTTTTSTTTTSTTSTTVTSTEFQSPENRLRFLSVSQGNIEPAFSPDVISYTLNVDYSCSTIRINAEPYDNTVKAVEGYGVKDLNVGINSFKITVTAQNGSQRQYGIIVIRAAQIETAAVVIDEVSSADAVTTAATTSEEPTTASEFDFTTLPPEDGEGSVEITPENSSPSDAVMKIMGVILGLVALFFFGFLSGYFIDKRMKRRDLENLQASGLAPVVSESYPLPPPALPEMYPEQAALPYAEPYPETVPMPYPAPYADQAGYAAQPGYPTQPGYLSQDGFAAQPGYAQSGYPAQAGFAEEPAVSYPDQITVPFVDQYPAHYGDSDGEQEEDEYEEEYEDNEPYIESSYGDTDRFGGLGALTNAAYPDSDESHDYYDD